MKLSFPGLLGFTRMGVIGLAVFLTVISAAVPVGKAAGAGDYQFGDGANNFSLFANTEMSGATYDSGTIRSNGSADWTAKYSMDLSPLSAAVDKGDLKVKVVLDATAYDEFSDNDLPEIWIGTNQQKLIGYGETEGDDEFNNVEGTVSKDSGWLGLSSGTRSIQLTFYTTDGESGDNRAAISNIRVYLQDSTAPVLKMLTVDEQAGLYKKDDTITFHLQFDEPVKVDTTKGVPMNTGGQAVYVSGNDTDTLTYRYTVQEGDNQQALNVLNSNPLSVVENTLVVTDLAGNECYTKSGTFSSEFDAAAYKADGTAPGVDSSRLDVAVDGTKLGQADRSAILRSGKTLEFTLYFTEPVNVNGEVELHFNNGGVAVNEDTGNGLDHLIFRYDGYSPDQDVDRLDFAESGALTGGTITDASGNPIALQSVPDLASLFDIRVDDTSPAVTFDVSGPEVWKKTHKITVHVSDSGSGAADQFDYQWMTQSRSVVMQGTSTPGATLEPPVDPEPLTGSYILSVQARDKAGNSSGVTDSPVVKLDNTLPEVTLEPNGGNQPKQSYSVTIHTEDSEAGVDTGNILFQWIPKGGSINENNWRRTSQDAQIESGETGAGSSGTWVLAVRATDLAAPDDAQHVNVTTFYSDDFVIDRDGPVITVSPDGSSQYAKSQLISVSSDDGSGSGIASLQYKWMDSENEPGPDGWQDVNGPIASEADWDGSMVLYLKAIDRSGNATAVHKTFLFDNEAPAVVFAPDGSLTASQDVNVGVTVTEEHSSPAELYELWKPAADPAPELSDPDWRQLDIGHPASKSGADGAWILYVKALDALGNAKVYASSSFLFDNTAPTGGIHIAQPHTQDRNVPVQLTVDSGTDDLGTVEYSLSETSDGGITWGDWSGWAAYQQNVIVTLPDQEGDYQIRVKYRDAARNESQPFTADVAIDRTPPAAEVQYSTTAPTKGAVSASLTPSEPVTITDGDGNEITGHTFTTNGSFIFHLRDEAGNTAEVTASVNWIYEEQVTVGMTPDGQAANAKMAKVKVEVRNTWPDPVDPQLKYQWNQSPTPEENSWRTASSDAALGSVALDGGMTSTVTVLTSVYTQFALSGGDGTWYLHVEAFDSDGVPTLKTSKPFLLDNTPPQATVVYAPSTPTGGPVKATLSFSNEEHAAITEPDTGANYHVFEENGSYTFKFHDEAGNEGTALATVDWIDASLPSAEIDYSTQALTNQPVTVTVSVYNIPGARIVQMEIPDEMQGTLMNQRTELDGSVTSSVYSFRQNGTFYADIAYEGIDRTDRIPVTIDNIDTVMPEGTIDYDTTDWTRGPVTATLSVSDNSGIVTVVGDRTYTFTENGTHAFTFKDGAGNTVTLNAEVHIIDTEKPTGTVHLSTSGWTNGKVTATLTAADNSGVPVKVTATDLSGASVSLDNSSVYVFERNGTIVYHLTDAAGNTADVTAVMDHIDTTPPTGTIAYSKDQTVKTNQDVMVTLTPANSPNQAVIINNNGSSQYTFTENGEFVFELQDEAGNTGTVRAVVSNIDKVAPQADIVYSKTALTNQNVEVTIKPNEAVSSTSLSHTFTENGSFDFAITDLAGNSSVIHTAVDYIDKTPPVAGIAYSTTAPTSQPVTAVISADEPFVVANNMGKTERVFYQNGSYDFTIMDKAGNMRTVSAIVNNIDSTPPQVQVTYSTTNPTNQPVTATISADEPITVLNNGGKNSYVFTANGRFTFLASDALGNQVLVDATVSNMDTSAPVLTFSHPEPLVMVKDGSIELDDVQAQDTADGDLTALITQDLGGFDASVPGSYTVTYTVSDQAGNVTAAQRTVTVLDPADKQVIINGHVADSDSMMMSGTALHFDYMNKEGDMTISWKAGKLNKGSMKSSAEQLDGTDFQAPGAGWYTFYIQDQERDARLVHVYMGAK